MSNEKNKSEVLKADQKLEKELARQKDHQVNEEIVDEMICSPEFAEGCK